MQGHLFTVLISFLAWLLLLHTSVWEEEEAEEDEEEEEEDVIKVHCSAQSALQLYIFYQSTLPDHLTSKFCLSPSSAPGAFTH